MSYSVSSQSHAPTLAEWLSAEWPRVRGWLAPAIEALGGTHTEHDIIAAVLCQSMQLWPGERSACVTELVTYPRLRSVNVVLGGGDLDELVDDLRPRIMKFGRAMGCDRIEVAGRPGWERKFKRATRRAVMLTEEL